MKLISVWSSLLAKKYNSHNCVKLSVQLWGGKMDEADSFDMLLKGNSVWDWVRVDFVALASVIENNLLSINNLLRAFHTCVLYSAPFLRVGDIDTHLIFHKHSSQ